MLLMLALALLIAVLCVAVVRLRRWLDARDAAETRRLALERFLRTLDREAVR